MKAFLQEYGLAIIIACVICLLVIMASPIGGTIKDKLNNTTQTLKSTNDKTKLKADNEINNFAKDLNPLKTSSTELTIQRGTTESITISGGRGEYNASTSASNIVINVSDNILNIRPKHDSPDAFTVTISDGKQKVNINVTSIGQGDNIEDLFD